MPDIFEPQRPTVEWSWAAQEINDDWLIQLERDIPGARVQIEYGNGRRSRLARADQEVRRRAPRRRLIASVHALQLLLDAGLPDVEVAWPADVLRAAADLGLTEEDLRLSDQWLARPDWCDFLIDAGRKLLPDAVRGGARAGIRMDAKGRPCTTGAFLESASSAGLPHQFKGAAWGQLRPWFELVWRAGAGKTYGSVLLASTFMGRMGSGAGLIITPAKGRQPWFRQLPIYTEWEPHELLPMSYRGKNYEDLSDYVARMHREGRPPIVIAGYESLPAILHEVLSYTPTWIAIDEIHEMSDRTRWTATSEADGQTSFSLAQTKGEQEKRAAALMQVCHRQAILKRGSLTASPIVSGKLSRAWAPWDLVDPYGLGSYCEYAGRMPVGGYAVRHCGATAGEYGGIVDNLSTNVAELASRAAWRIYDAPRSETHATLPALRTEILWLEEEDLVPAGSGWAGLDREGQAWVRSGVRPAVVEEEDLEAESGPGWLREVRLAEAAATKRPWVCREVVAEMQSGEGSKALVFTGRRGDCEIWAQEIASAWARDCRVSGRRTPDGQDAVRFGHGGHSQKEREALVEWFANHPGPCALIATGQAMGTSFDGLQCATLGIFAMLPDIPGWYDQWSGRLDRHGGGGARLLVPLARGTFDEVVAAALAAGFDTVDAYLTMSATGIAERFRSMRSLDSAVAASLKILGLDWLLKGGDSDRP